jgi:CheY-like chemotaxis protein
MISSDSCFLLVEDNPVDVKLVQMAFDQLGLNPVPVVHDGEEAIDYLLSLAARGASPPHAILLDIKMPRMDGLQFLEWLRRRAPEHLGSIPVIVMSTSGDPADIRRADELGVDSYMVKPISWRQFQKQVEGMYEFWCCESGPGGAAGKNARAR